MQSLYRSKKRTSQYGDANYSVSCSAEYGRIWKFEEIRGFHSPRYRVCNKAKTLSKGSWGDGESKNVIFVSVQNAHLPVRGCKLPGFM